MNYFYKIITIIIVAVTFSSAQSLSGLKICLDPGHGFVPGQASVCGDAETKRFEGYVNHIVVPYLKRFLLSAGATVITTRADFDSVSPCITLTQRKTIANNNNVNFFHSVHHNAFNGTSNYSLSLFKQLNNLNCPNGNPAWPNQADRMAEIQAARLYGALNTTSGIHRGDYCFLTYNLGVLSTLNMPGTLSEGSFFDFPAEKIRLSNLDYLETEAEALYHSFLQYYNQPMPSHGSLTGIVTNSTTGQPAKGVRIEIESVGKVCVLDELGSGFYRFDSLPQGSYNLKLTTSRDTMTVIGVVQSGKITKLNLSFRVTEIVGDVKIKAVQATSSSIFFQWEKPTGSVDFYDIYLSQDGNNFDSLPYRSVAGNLLSSSISGLTAGNSYYIKMKARNNLGESTNFSNVYGAYVSGNSKKVLIIDGFTRNTGGGSYTQPNHNFAAYYGEALSVLNVKFETVGSFAVNQSAQLLPYTAVIWFLGDESVQNETFSSVEQTVVKDYLKQGGKLFVTGSEIGFDLFQNGDFNDKDFYNKFLKAAYIADEPNPNFPIAEPVAGSIFNGISNFTFGITYPEDHPDVIDTLNGSVPVLQYNSSQLAGIAFSGMFPSGVISGKLVYLSFAFETIEDTSVRNLILRRIIEFFDVPTGVEEKSEVPFKANEIIVIPNPVTNNSRIICMIKEGGKYNIDLFDHLGRLIEPVFNGELREGNNEIPLNLRNQPTGVYYLRLSGVKQNISTKLLYLK